MSELAPITFRQIQCFLEICRDFHFSKAAARLGLTQPPLSRNIKELERAIGTALFDRSLKRVCLTPAGHAFLDEVYQIPTQVNRAVDSAQRAGEGESSVIKIGFVGALLGHALLGVIDQFRESFPDTQVKLVDDSPARLIEQVEGEELDGVFLGLKPDRVPRGMDCLIWKNEPLFACVSRRHHLATAKRVTLGTLSRERIIALSARIAPSYRSLIDQLFDSQSSSPVVVQETERIPTLVGMIAAGAGIALLPESAIESAQSSIEAIPIRSAKAQVGNSFVYRRGSGKSILEDMVALLRTVAR